MSLYSLEVGSSKRHDPVNVTVGINGKQVGMEIDAGAAVSVVSASSYGRLSNEELRESDLRLRTYTGQIVKPKGVAEVEMTYKDQKMKLSFTVVEGNVPTLLGRDWLERLKLCWSELFPLKINTIEIDERVRTIKDKYPDVFSGKLGCLKDFKVHIPLPDNIQPRFIKARTVPFALGERVDRVRQVRGTRGLGQGRIFKVGSSNCSC